MICGKVVGERTIVRDKVVFRYPKFEDYGELLGYINEVVSEGAYLNTMKKKSKKEEIEFVAEMLKKCENRQIVCLVAEVNGKVSGMANVDKLREAEAHAGTLGIALRKNARGKGIGKLLMETVIFEAKKSLKIEIVVLEVFAENERAIALYKKLGFRKFGTLKNGLKRRGKYSDKIMMAKHLN
ncbi:MAG: GNAT family N-acetyltransferase [Candidatus Aenigmatarchaeota archaeon]